jgi:predicted dehydrogenase
MKKTYRAAAIGSTGRGNYGHGLDTVFRDLPGVEFVAIADDNPAGLCEAGKRNGIHRLYTSYRVMLADEELDLVSVAMRHSDLHEEIVVACAEAGKHVYCEKPFAPDVASADRMLSACRANGVKIALATQNRASLAVRQALEMVQSGRIGTLLSMRGRGKEDKRGGGEDLMVLGYHILDLMVLFAGRPEWVFADVRQDGREMAKSDARQATEPIGPIAGDWLAAMYGFPGGVHGYFESHRGLEGSNDRFSLELHGSDGIIVMRSLRDVVWLDQPVFNPAKAANWQPINPPEWAALASQSHWCNQQLVLDLLRAVEEGREPITSGENSLAVLEMIQGVYGSHLAQGRLAIPLQDREHPLA